MSLQCETLLSRSLTDVVTVSLLHRDTSHLLLAQIVVVVRWDGGDERSEGTRARVGDATSERGRVQLRTEPPGRPRLAVGVGRASFRVRPSSVRPSAALLFLSCV